MSKIKLTGDTSGYIEISAPNVAANNTLELGGGTKILTNLDNVFTGVTTYSGNIDLNANLDLGDNNIVRLGTGNDLQIYHNGSNSYIDDSGTGALFVRGNYLAFAGINGEQLINAEQNAAVELFHDGTKKLETTTTGATVTGTLVSGSVTSELDLTAISSSISGTAVDVFVYDTRKDSDGGAWRKRTQHTSWYNETLNTSIRGSRREFPAVAVIVAEDSAITIYDGDDPDLPMWMSFSEGNKYLLYSNATLGSVSALNGILCYGDPGQAGGCYVVNFINENSKRYGTGGYDTFIYPLSQRQSAGWTNNFVGTGIVNWYVNDVAMTVLPNAPIDDATGLPVPTIAVATNGGVSVIKDNGTVFDVIDSNGARKCYDVSFTKDHKIMHTGDLGAGSTHAGNVFVTNILTADRGEYDNNSDLYRWYSTSQNYPRINGGNTFNTRVLDPVDVGGHHYAMADVGMSLIEDGTSSSVSNTDGMVAYITSDYNSGYQYGDIKGAFLSDTDTTNAVAAYYDDFANNDNGWGFVNCSITSGNLVITQQSQARATDGDALSHVSTGVKLVFTFTVSGSGTGAVILDDDGAGAGVGGNTTYGTFSSTGSHTFTATKTASPRLRFIRQNGSNDYNINFLNITTEYDRSVNNKGLQVFGTVTKSAVATGADLVAYSGWSSSNYLLQPPNSDLAFGNNVFSVMCWFKTSQDHSATDSAFLIAGDDGSNQLFDLRVHSDEKLLWQVTDDGYSTRSRIWQAGPAVDDGAWHCVVATRTSDNKTHLYLDGDLIGSSTSESAEANLSNSIAFSIGIENAYGGTKQKPWGGSIALARILGSVPSPEQIKKIYEDEKVLFQENAKATLYGSSDAVTALGYDEDTELLHVGTSAGRSDFRGLRRINNTTTAVTTAISASDDLIAEQ